ncbi:MAG: PHP domain-containing protein [Candidatus Hydrogenedentota bacterium]
MWTLIDTHIHSEFSDCSGLRLEDIVKKAVSAGLDGICITDHNNNSIKDKADYISKKCDFLIITGIEFWTEIGDIICFGLNREYHYTGQYLVNSVNDILNGNEGCLFILPHPFRMNFETKLDKFEQIKDKFSAIEVLNTNASDEANLKAYEYALKNGFKITGGSDAHSLDKVGRYVTAIKSRVRSEDDFIREIKYGRYYGASLFGY